MAHGPAHVHIGVDAPVTVVSDCFCARFAEGGTQTVRQRVVMRAMRMRCTAVITRSSLAVLALRPPGACAQDFPRLRASHIPGEQPRDPARWHCHHPLLCQAGLGPSPLLVIPGRTWQPSHVWTQVPTCAPTTVVLVFSRRVTSSWAHRVCAVFQRPEEFLADTPESDGVDVSSAISATAGAVLEVALRLMFGSVEWGCRGSLSTCLRRHFV